MDFLSSFCLLGENLVLSRHFLDGMTYALFCVYFPISKTSVQCTNCPMRNTRPSVNVCKTCTNSDRIISKSEPPEVVKTTFFSVPAYIFKHTSRHRVLSDVISLKRLFVLARKTCLLRNQKRRFSVTWV